MKRIFFALSLAAFREPVKIVIGEARRAVPLVKWADPEQVHVTLHFFGPTPEANLGEINRLARGVANFCAPMRLGLAGVGYFPTPVHPQIAWLGLSGQTELLEECQRKLERAFANAGFPCGERAFHAHATIGRLKNPPRPVLNLPDSLRHFEVSPVPIDRAVLYESFLSSQGPRYEILKEYFFQNHPAA